MRNRTGKILIAIVTTAILAVPAAAELTARQVLVVANADSRESVELAKLYVQSREIPAENLLLLDTSQGYEIDRVRYETQIAEPIRAYLQEKDLASRIRCIVLLYGIPVRVAGPIAPTGQAAKVVRDVVNDTRRRISVATELAKTIGGSRDLPRNAENAGLLDLEKLFGDLPSPGGVKSPEEAVREVMKVLGDARSRAGRLGSDRARTVAARQIQSIVLQLYGLEGMLRVFESSLDDSTKRKLHNEIAERRETIGKLRARPLNNDQLRHLLAQQIQLEGLLRTHHRALSTLSAQPDDMADASVDSELALLWYDMVDLPKWVANPLHHEARRKQAAIAPTLMTCRLDGPSAADVRRLIRDSIAVEKAGLKGNVYIDAGGLPRAAAYDKNFLQLAKMLTRAFEDQRQPDLKIRLDEGPELLPANSAPDAALYVGWYSLKRYVPAFKWQQGAVGWHVSSFEAQDLRDSDSQTWCVKMLQSGVAATMGAVNEPYLAAFPLPQEFFPLLLTGRLTLAECYWATVPHASWRMTLIGDPLYRPFAANPLMTRTDLPGELGR